MPQKSLKQRVNYESRIQEALTTYQIKEISSLRVAARCFKVTYKTVTRRYHVILSRLQIHEMQQFLTNAKEKTLVRWIKQYTITEASLTNSLLKKLAREIRFARVSHASNNILSRIVINSFNDKWIYRFKTRHSTI